MRYECEDCFSSGFCDKQMNECPKCGSQDLEFREEYDCEIKFKKTETK